MDLGVIYMKEKIQRFLWGRYGSDELNRDILYIEIVLMVISLFSRNRIWIILFDVFMFYSFYRMLSKNISARYQENTKWIHAKKKYSHIVKAFGKGMKDSSHKYFVCPNCTQIIRVPKGKGNIEVRCPNCREKFEKRS